MARSRFSVGHTRLVRLLSGLLALLHAQELPTPRELICSSGISAARAARAALVRTKTPDADGLFSLRVASLRLSTLVHTFGVLLPQPHVAALRALRHGSNAARDATVSARLLRETSCAAPTSTSSDSDACAAALDALTQISAGRAQRKALASLHSALDSAFLRAIIIFEACDDMHLKRPIHISLKRVLRKVEDAATRAARALGEGCAQAAAEGEVEESLHALRSTIRAMRFSIESMHPRLGEELHALTRALGSCHDAAVLTHTLTAHATRVKGDADDDATTDATKQLGAGLTRLALYAHAADTMASTHMHTAWFGSAHDVAGLAHSRLARLLGVLAEEFALPPTVSVNSSGGDGVEVERRWLLSRLPPALSLWDMTGACVNHLPHGVRALDVRQGYIPGSVISERLRSRRRRWT